MCNSSRQARREERHIRREEKNIRRIEKHKRKAEILAMRQEIRNLRHNNDSNYCHQYSSHNDTQQIESFEVEEMIATLRIMFPECEPQYIRTCIVQETNDHVQKVTDKLLSLPYPKITIVSTAPSAPQLPLLNDEYDYSLPPYEPPSYNEALLNLKAQESLKEEFSVSSIPNDNKTEYSTPNDISHNFNISLNDSPPNNFSRMVEQICKTHSAILTRPLPENFIRSLPPNSTQTCAIIPKNGTTIQNGFPIASYPTQEFESLDISHNDWEIFIKGLNMLLGVSNSPEVSTSSTSTSTSSSPTSNSIFGHLKWIVGGGNNFSGGSNNNCNGGDKQMEEFTRLTKKYLKRWNNEFFKPRKVEIELISKNKNHGRSIFKNKSDYVQYLSVKIFM
ncbi:4074_t:CDS:2 [Diversispora eburnea]|uniref:4074_t:CDS:1 n=1 Tax=Diversispora eburnea TaxID=1213867 RepID=A0A9N9FJ99_9GLOM|nr:4074_t:CDS:2 [Diversispora eburnea]